MTSASYQWCHHREVMTLFHRRKFRKFGVCSWSLATWEAMWFSLGWVKLIDRVQLPVARAAGHTPQLAPTALEAWWTPWAQAPSVHRMGERWWKHCSLQPMTPEAWPPTNNMCNWPAPFRPPSRCTWPARCPAGHTLPVSLCGRPVGPGQWLAAQ